MIRIKFYGVRGSTPCSGPAYEKYGGHTSCVGVWIEDQLFIFDAGSGIFDLGIEALEAKNKHATLLLSHVHLDHILGLPLFPVIWEKDYHLDILAAHLEPVGGVEKFFNVTYKAPVFPVSFSNVAAQLKYRDIKTPSLFTLGGNVQIATIPLNHPNGATGYRLSYQGFSICYITDTEHRVGCLDSQIVSFIKEADVFIYDTTYADELFSSKVGWGHSTWQEALRLGKAASVKRCVLFHHDPLNTDDKMACLEHQVKQSWEKAIVARQGMVLTLE